MFEILGIQIPAEITNADGVLGFSGMTDSDALKVLGESVLAAAKEAAKAEGVTPDKLAEIKSARDFAKAAAAELAARAEATAAFEAERDAVLASLEDDTDEDAADESSEDEGDESGASDEADAEEADEVESVTAGWTPTAGAAKARAPRPVSTPTPKVPAGTYAEAGFRACTGVDGKQSGDEFESILALGEALMETWELVKGSDRRVPVGRLQAHFTDEQKLSADPAENVAKFGGMIPGSPEAIRSVTAALCAPTEPLYAIATMSSTARPVKGSLATYKPARGAVSVYPSPKLSDIVDGAGIWTAADDANGSATKVAAATIACADSETYTMYGLYSVITIKNMLAMTFPELVEAYLNRLGAVTARLGDSSLLDAGINSVNTNAYTSTSNEYGASINLFESLLRLIATYREEERYGDQQFDGWFPRWVIPALKADIMRMRKTSGSFRDRIPSTAEVTALFADVGCDVTWTLDSAASWPTPPTLDLSAGGAIPEYPTTISGLLTPKGNLRALDRGQLTIGVAPGNIYRDNASNTKNQFTIFQEGFEGLMDFGATNCAFSLEDVCLSGAQVADVTAITCGS